MLECGTICRFEFVKNLSVETERQKKKYAVGDKVTAEVIGKYNEKIDFFLEDGTVLYNVPRSAINPFSLG